MDGCWDLGTKVCHAKSELDPTMARPLILVLGGYDIERELEPGEPARLSFDADLTGRFEIEDYETEEELGTLVVEPR